MEPDEVLHQFIELCNTRSGFLQYHLASNAVLEWFGRTVRGGKRVYRYYRYDLCQQYEHHFQNAQRCGPIETKSSHMQTRQILIAGDEGYLDKEHQRSIIEFTPDHSKPTPKLASLTQGREFLPIGDDDLTDLGLACIQDAVTPPQNNSQWLPPGEPVPKKAKYCKAIISDNSDHESSTDECSKSKSVDGSKIEKTKSEDSSDEETKYERKSDTASFESNSDMYSELLYIESVGTLRMLNKLKHRGVSTSGMDNSVESGNSYWDRETKIKISYRIRKDTQQIQFALIIYEHVTRNPTLRRNLLVEFQKADDNGSIKTVKKLNPPEVKRKVPLKRTLRLF